jgi:hypothetical protein
MTRITLSEFKGAARNRTARWSAPNPSAAPLVTPMPQAQSAIRRFHQQGAARATAVLHQTFDRSAYWGPTGRPPARSWANNIKTYFETYVQMASVDTRPIVPAPLKRDVAFGPHAIGVAPDVVLIDPEGYVARLVLWDRPTTSHHEAELLAAPIVRALDDELGPGRTVGVEIWHVQSGQQYYVPAADALRRLPDVRSILDGYVD